jgi:Protein of unknwon function (DUF3310)
MVTRKKRRSKTMTAHIRAYIAENPEVKPKRVAELYSIPLKSVYQITYQMRKKEKPVIITATQAAIANKLGVSTEEYAKKVYELTRGRDRRHPITGKRLMQGADIVSTHHTDMVNHPPHYKQGGIETIDFIEAKALGYNLGNVVKYITRADHKGNKLEDLKKAQWYLNRAIEKLN